MSTSETSRVHRRHASRVPAGLAAAFAAQHGLSRQPEPEHYSQHVIPHGWEALDVNSGSCRFAS